jgi:hypothetical protein
VCVLLAQWVTLLVDHKRCQAIAQWEEQTQVARYSGRAGGLKQIVRFQFLTIPTSK